MKLSRLHLPIVALSLLTLPKSAVMADDALAREPGAITVMEEAEALLKPFTGQRAPHAVDPSTLDGKIMCGYQGWFFAPGDGSGGSWGHYGPGGKFAPGSASVEMWPDMSETGAGEQFATGFHYPDGQVATVFSSYRPETVNRHFKWMADYGIDGAFVQRFGTRCRKPQEYAKLNAVLDHERNAANANGRTWAIMYDISGLKDDEVPALIVKDWKALVDRMKITSDPGYQRHNGKPLVAVWGIGFGGHRQYTTKACGELIDFLKNDPQYGGNAVMLGVPTSWRTQDEPLITQEDENLKDPLLVSVISKADIVSPWNVGRYKTAGRFQTVLKAVGEPDLTWCRSNHLAYMPVIFPGFSWVNLMAMRGKDAHDVSTPREHGTFFWKQGAAWINQGVRMLYVAMFDEIDEGTAIFKVTNHPPVSDQNVFVTLDGDPTDHYLWLAGKLGDALKKSGPVSDDMPPQLSAVAAQAN